MIEIQLVRFRQTLHLHLNYIIQALYHTCTQTILLGVGGTRTHVSSQKAGNALFVVWDIGALSPSNSYS